MYKFERYRQLGIADFNQSVGLKMNPENRWVKKAKVNQCTVPLIFNQINMAIYAVSWYNKRNGGDLLWQDQRNIEFP